MNQSLCLFNFSNLAKVKEIILKNTWVMNIRHDKSENYESNKEM